MLRWEHDASLWFYLTELAPLWAVPPEVTRALRATVAQLVYAACQHCQFWRLHRALVPEHSISLHVMDRVTMLDLNALRHNKPVMRQMLCVTLRLYYSFRFHPELVEQYGQFRRFIEFVLERGDQYAQIDASLMAHYVHGETDECVLSPRAILPHLLECLYRSTNWSSGIYYRYADLALHINLYEVFIYVVQRLRAMPWESINRYELNELLRHAEAKCGAPFYRHTRAHQTECTEAQRETIDYIQSSLARSLPPHL